METDLLCLTAGEHGGPVKGAGLCSEELEGSAKRDEAIGRIVVGVRPDSELGIVRQRAAEVELVAVVAAGGIRTGGDGDALLVTGKGTVEL